MEVDIEINATIEEYKTIELYRANKWSSAQRPDLLMPALQNSHSLVTARKSGKLIAIGYAISDGHLVVYYPHMLVHPAYHGKGIGRKMMEAMQSIYCDFQMQILTADGEAIEFCKALGFERAGITEPMWVYSGSEH